MHTKASTAHAYLAATKALVALVAAALIVSAVALPAFAATCPSIARTLARGATGADVTALQQFLITQGVLSADSATGYFGPLTEKAVQAFQQKQNLVSSGTAATTGFGFVGKRTSGRIASLCGSATQKFQSAPAGIKAKVVPKLTNPNCPQVPLPIGKSCTGKWKEVRDTIRGCTASWQCTAK
ncbi:MAG: hypothetical protein A2854_00685 [Parcubacteria group bacterium RIFCSPHIGHO2_01_FULL_56_18]|nr:MAG: hypothetical protein A2854_00685 [Parcubacteria group bacterium RIFCSPHIGHO2_01_FULL_56_18]